MAGDRLGRGRMCRSQEQFLRFKKEEACTWLHTLKEYQESEKSATDPTFANRKTTLFVLRRRFPALSTCASTRRDGEDYALPATPLNGLW